MQRVWVWDWWGLLFFYDFYKICHIKAPTRFVHNFWWWCSNLIKLLPIESWESGLSIGERISVWGHHNQKLWPNRIGTWMSTYHTVLQKNVAKFIPIPGYGYDFCRFVEFLDIETPTFDSDVQFLWKWYRSKAESQGFPSVKESTPEDITIKSYGPIELVS